MNPSATSGQERTDRAIPDGTAVEYPIRTTTRREHATAAALADRPDEPVTEGHVRFFAVAMQRVVVLESPTDVREVAEVLYLSASGGWAVEREIQRPREGWADVTRSITVSADSDVPEPVSEGVQEQYGDALRECKRLVAAAMEATA